MDATAFIHMSVKNIRFGLSNALSNKKGFDFNAQQFFERKNMMLLDITLFANIKAEPIWESFSINKISLIVCLFKWNILVKSLSCPYISVHAGCLILWTEVTFVTEKNDLFFSHRKWLRTYHSLSRKKSSTLLL